MLSSFNRDSLHCSFDAAAPFRFVVIDNFLDPEFAREISECFPTLVVAEKQGHRFHAVNERRKVQITDPSLFPAPVARLHALLSGVEFVRDLSAITGISELLADPTLAGGGMHLTGPGGRLDVHVDFNRIGEKGLFRRLNLLLFLNREWHDAWGGRLELWDSKVRSCHHALLPVLNRCVIFETSEISFHGVSAVRCPSAIARQSYAAYYYTASEPPGWDGRDHSTIFRARPDERLKRFLLMPLESGFRAAKQISVEAVRRMRARVRSRAQ